MADFQTEMTQKLRAGGEEGIRIFLGMSKLVRKNSGNQGIAEWVKVGYPALPLKDQQVVLALLLDSYLQHEGSRIEISSDATARES
jgi:hypothetical protein